jgi:hypothetical protein
MSDTIPGHPHTTAGNAALTGRIERRWFQHLQALEDAIAYRRARVSAPCPDCTASRRACDDHACDLNLITAYQQTAIAVILNVSRRIHASHADHDHGGFAAVFDADPP